MPSHKTYPRFLQSSANNLCWFCSQFSMRLRQELPTSQNWDGMITVWLTACWYVIDLPTVVRKGDRRVFPICETTKVWRYLRKSAFFLRRPWGEWYKKLHLVKRINGAISTCRTTWFGMSGSLSSSAESYASETETLLVGMVCQAHRVSLASPGPPWRQAWKCQVTCGE